MSKKSKRMEVATENPVVVSDIPAVAEAPAVAEVPASPEVAISAETKTVSFKYPREGGKCWLIWKHCDSQLEANGKPPTVKEVREHALHPDQVAAGWNVSNASQEFYRWRQWKGLPR